MNRRSLVFQRKNTSHIVLNFQYLLPACGAVMEGLETVSVMGLEGVELEILQDIGPREDHPNRVGTLTHCFARYFPANQLKYWVGGRSNLCHRGLK